MSDQFPRSPFAGSGQTDTAVLLIANQGGALGCKLLKHPCHRRSADAQPRGQSIRRDPGILRAAQFEDGFQIVANGLRGSDQMKFSWH